MCSLDARAVACFTFAGFQGQKLRLTSGEVYSNARHGICWGQKPRCGCGSKLDRRGRTQVLVHVSAFQV